jgi:small-conductance mechanosensitive channel
MDRKNIICIFSSFIFVINIIVAYYYKYYIYGSLFVALFISSILFHSNPQNIYTNIIDRIIILAIFMYGGYIFVTKQKQKQIQKNNNIQIQIAIILSFLTTIYLYYYGYLYNKYCYDTNIQIANIYHSLLHVIGSIGHILIIIM